MRDAVRTMRETNTDHNHGGRTNRQVDVEDPVPGQSLGDHAAEQRSGDAAGGEDAGEQTLIAAAFPWRNEVADNGLRQGDQASGAQPLYGTEQDQLRHASGQTAKGRPGEKDQNGDEEGPLSPEDVTQFPVKWGRHRRCDHERRHHPRQMRQAAEIADDVR